MNESMNNNTKRQILNEKFLFQNVESEKVFRILKRNDKTCYQISLRNFFERWSNIIGHANNTDMQPLNFPRNIS